jgi:uncharacterized protein (DUF924 family)
MTMNSEELLSFWFGKKPQRVGDVKQRMATWFGANRDLDRDINLRFSDLASAAAAGELDEWAVQARTRLALILALDQLPRNIYRGDALAFAQDNKALALTLDGMSTGMDSGLTDLQRLFFYMPLQHSEDLQIQDAAVAAYEQLMLDAGKLTKSALTSALDYARQHRDLIQRFGRFPHRNALLGRESTPQEIQFLAEGGATFGQ